MRAWLIKTWPNAAMFAAGVVHAGTQSLISRGLADLSNAQDDLAGLQLTFVLVRQIGASRANLLGDLVGQDAA